MASVVREVANEILSRTRFGFRTRQIESVVTLSGTSAILIGNNPDRVMLQVILEGTNPVWIGRNGEMTAGSGIPLLATGDSVTWTPERDGQGTGYERWGISNAGVLSVKVRVVETIRAREVGE